MYKKSGKYRFIDQLGGLKHKGGSSVFGLNSDV